MDTNIKINNGEKEYELNINSDDIEKELTKENFMQMWNECMVKPIVERRKKHLDKMTQLLYLLDEKDSLNIRNWLIKNNQELYIKSFLETVRNDLEDYKIQINQLIESKFMNEIDEHEIMDEKEFDTWKEKIESIENKIIENENNEEINDNNSNVDKD